MAKNVNTMSKKRRTEKATFGERPGGRAEVSSPAWGKSTGGREGSSKCKGPEVSVHLACSRAQRKVCGWRRWVQGCAVGDEPPKGPEQAVALWVIFRPSEEESHCRL